MTTLNSGMIGSSGSLEQLLIGRDKLLKMTSVATASTAACTSNASSSTGSAYRTMSYIEI